MGTSALDILCEAEALRREALKRSVAPLPASNGAVEVVSQPIQAEHPMTGYSECLSLLETASSAFREFKVETSVAYDPSEIFWQNPDEPKHSRLLEYFVRPRAEHGWGLFLLRRLLSTLNIISPELPVDEHCEVACEKWHIDLLVKRNPGDASPDGGRYAIIIENKVNGAADQGKQLQGYYDRVREMGFEHGEIFVCYLTLWGGSPSENSIGTIRDRLRERTFRD